MQLYYAWETDGQHLSTYLSFFCVVQDISDVMQRAVRQGDVQSKAQPVRCGGSDLTGTTEDPEGPVNSQGCSHQSLNCASDPHPPFPAPIIPITATFSDKCKVVQNVSQPARKRGQARVLTVSSGSIKRYCVCRQLLTVQFVSVWVCEVGNCGERNREGRGGCGGGSSNAWHMFLSFWFPLRSLG